MIKAVKVLHRSSCQLIMRKKFAAVIWQIVHGAAFITSDD